MTSLPPAAPRATPDAERATVERLREANLLTDMAQFMDAAKPDLGNQWSVWDQSVRDRITARLTALAADDATANMHHPAR